MYIYQQNFLVPYHRSCDEAQFSTMACMFSPPLFDFVVISVNTFDLLWPCRIITEKENNTSSGPANSTGTGNSVGSSPNSPVSTHTPGDGVNTASSLQHVSSGQKGI